MNFKSIRFIIKWWLHLPEGYVNQQIGPMLYDFSFINKGKKPTTLKKKHANIIYWHEMLTEMADGYNFNMYIYILKHNVHIHDFTVWWNYVEDHQNKKPHKKVNQGNGVCLDTKNVTRLINSNYLNLICNKWFIIRCAWFFFWLLAHFEIG